MPDADLELAWEACTEEGDQCRGARATGITKCLAHATRDEFERAVEQMDGRLDLRGVEVDSVLLRAAIKARGTPHFRGVACTAATFRGSVSFAGLHVSGHAEFDRAVFEGPVDFSYTRFRRIVSFTGVRFAGHAVFVGVGFQRFADFSEARFEKGASFGWSTFGRNARFRNTSFQGSVWFGGVVCARSLECVGTGFGARLRRQEVVARQVNLAYATFHLDASVGLSAERVILRGTKFSGALSLRLAHAEVVMEGTEFERRALVTTATGLPHPLEAIHDRRKEIDDKRAWEQRSAGPNALARSERPVSRPPRRPRLLTLRRANVENLTVSGLDLTPCEFLAAHGLAQLQIDGELRLAPINKRFRAKRLAISEEHEWRADPERSAERAEALGRSSKSSEWQWYGSDPSVLDEEPSPAQIAGLYRQLRKGREERADAPGAADFYFGEMEMRRHARASGPNEPGTPFAERQIITGYWLLAGYGLRAWRSAATLAIVIATAAATFKQFGFHEHVGYMDSLLFAVRSAVSFVSPPRGDLTSGGQWLQLLLRFLGPALLAVTVLSIRARVRR